MVGRSHKQWKNSPKAEQSRYEIQQGSLGGTVTGLPSLNSAMVFLWILHSSGLWFPHADESSSDCSVFEPGLGLSIRAAILRSKLMVKFDWLRSTL